MALEISDTSLLNLVSFKTLVLMTVLSLKLRLFPPAIIITNAIAVDFADNSGLCPV